MDQNLIFPPVLIQDEIEDKDQIPMISEGDKSAQQDLKQFLNHQKVPAESGSFTHSLTKEANQRSGAPTLSEFRTVDLKRSYLSNSASPIKSLLDPNANIENEKSETQDLN